MMSKKCKIRTQNQKNHKLLECFCKNEKIIFFCPGDVGGDFFRAPRLRAVPALRSSLLLYSKGFALLTFKNGVEIAAVGGGAASIDGHAVPKVQEWSCRDLGTGAWRRPRAEKGRQRLQKPFFDENHSVFCSKFVFLAGLFPGITLFFRVLGTKSDRCSNIFPT